MNLTLKPSRFAATLLSLTAAALFGGASATPATPFPSIVQRWADAWNTADADGMAELFTADGVYEDVAFQFSSRGKEGVAMWVSITNQGLSGVNVEVIDAFRRGDQVAVRWTFSGTVKALGTTQVEGSKPFSVPAASLFVMDGDRIRSVTDFYNLADLLRQSGIPADAYVPPEP